MPERIVSLLPSATEILCALGLRDRLVGVSHECDYPADISDLPVVTSSQIASGQSSRAIDDQVREHLDGNSALYSLNNELLRSLAPDLIVTQALCDVCAVSARDVEDAACGLATVSEVVNLEPANLQDVFATIRAVGKAAGVAAQADRLVKGLEIRLAAVIKRSAAIPPEQQPSVLMLEWVDPPFNAGHWTPELVGYAGGRDQLGDAGKPSRTISWAAVRDADPDVLVIACCGFGIERTLDDVEALYREAWWPDLTAVSNGKVFVIDGNHYFNRPGPRLIDSMEILGHALHPDVHSLPRGLEGTFVNVRETLFAS